MAKKVTAIPATISRFTAAPINSVARRKVAGYARVSTDHEDQVSSYEAQVDYYTNYIKSRDDWEFVDIYTDEGITATNTKKREGFKQMIEDALAGKIQLIITKSVSRFARNTVDSLTTIRKLKENGIEVYFEKENIWTLDAKGELLLTIMSSLAQEEARNISENTTWGHRKRFADGKYSLNYGRFLGYDKGPEGGLVINEEEAKTIRYIYQRFLAGLSYYAISKELQAMGAKAPGGSKWYANTVQNILSNEKYKGDALLQKTYTADFLTKTLKKNSGEVPQYYIEDDHEAIIDPQVFDLVQIEIERRSKSGKHYSGSGIFASKIKCAECGGWYGAKVWHSNDRYRRVVYRCNHKYGNGEPCGTPHFTEEELKELFIAAFNKVVDIKDEVIGNIRRLMEIAGANEELEKEQHSLEQELEIVVGMINDLVSENAHKAQDQGDYQKRYEALVERYNTGESRYNEVTAQLEEKKARLEVLRYELETLEKQDGPAMEFNESTWGAMVDYATVHAKDDVRFTFRHGAEIKA
jgi:site-specific DNA recombinase